MQIRNIELTRTAIENEVARTKDSGVDPSVIIVGDIIWEHLHGEIDRMTIFIRGLEPMLFDLRLIKSELCPRDEFYIY